MNNIRAAWFRAVKHGRAAELAKGCRAALVQVIGRNVLLYRPRPATDPRPSLEMEL